MEENDFAKFNNIWKNEIIRSEMISSKCLFMHPWKLKWQVACNFLSEFNMFVLITASGLLGE